MKIKQEELTVFVLKNEIQKYKNNLSCQINLFVIT